MTARRAAAAALLVLAGIAGLAHLAGCGSVQTPPADEGDAYRRAMRTLVQDLSAYARARRPGFVVVPQNGHELLTTDGTSDGPLAAEYLAAVDGQAREDLFYGYHADDEATPAAVRREMTAYLTRLRQTGRPVLVADYASARTHVDDAYARAAAAGFVSFVAPRRALDVVPAYPSPPPGAHPGAVAALSDVRTFLYLLDPSRFATRAAYLAALRAAPHDLLVIDGYAPGEAPLTADEVDALRRKPGGARRLVLAYLSIGEAEDYRPYWRAAWSDEPPEWLGAENPDWPGNYAVRYWHPEWRSLLFGTEDAYLDRLLAAGFDGVYLDRIDAFEGFE